MATTGEATLDVATRRWVLIAAVIGSSMVFLDGSTVNVALPALQASLGATVVDVQWVVNGYTLFLASLLLLGGSLGDRLGRRRIFMAGVAVFTAASIWCGAAPSTGHLIAARALQGVGGALLTPGSLALINAAYPADARGQAIGTWAAFSGIMAAVGPVLGGWLIDTASWRWIFFLNVPAALAVLVIAGARVPESRGDAHGRPDLLGAALATLGLGGIVFALLESSTRGVDDPLVRGAGAAGVALLAAFVMAERRVAAPMLPPSLFRSLPFTGINVLTLLIYATLAGLTFFLPMYLIQVHGYSATAAGASMLPFVVLLFVLSRPAGALMDRVGARTPLVAGSLLVAASFVLFALPGLEGGYWSGVFPAVVVLGLGMSLVVAPLTTTVMASVPDALAGTASGVNNAISRVAGLLAIGVLGVVMVTAFSARLTTGLDGLDLPPPQQEAILAARTDLAALTPPEGLAPEARDAVADLVDGAFLAGFRRLMLVMAGVALAGAGVAWATIRGGSVEGKAPSG